MTTLAERISEAIDASGKQGHEIATACGVTPAAVTHWRNGSTKTLKALTAQKLSEVTGYQEKWLLTGVGQKKTSLPSFYAEVGGSIGATFADEEGLILQLSEGNVALRNHWLAEVAAFHRERGTFHKPSAAPTPIELEGNPDYPAVRRVSVKAQAGITGYAVENCEDGAPIVFRADWYRTHNYRPERMMALRVAGESMVPSLYPDDLIVVNTESTTPRDGVAFLVAYYGEVTVKRLVMDAGQWWLNSDNSDQRRHPRKLCDESTVLIGEVVYKQSERV